MRLRLVMFIVGAAVLTACGPKAPAAANSQASASQASASQASAEDDINMSTPSQSAPVIVVLGDSLTAGFNLPPGNALPAALQRDFEAKGLPAKFVNAGVSGDTTADGLARYDWSVKGSGANLLVVALGANDFLNGLAPEIPKRNLAAILDRAKADNLHAVLLGVSIPGGGADRREAAYAAIYPNLAKTYGVPYFSDMLGAVAARPELIQQDGIHPTEDGVEAMASAITAFLAPLVRDLP